MARRSDDWLEKYISILAILAKRCVGRLRLPKFYREFPVRAP